MRGVGYIVPSDLLSATPPGDGWHATANDGDPLRSLVMVEWANPNLEAEFESLPGVIPIGRPWETPSVEVADFLAAFSAAALLQTDVTSAVALPANPDTSPPTSAATVASALRALDWPMARLLR
jgi:hypothetical protein